MSSRSQADLCRFDNASKRCQRCGFLAPSLPFYRACRTLEEEARAMLEHHATSRISVPPIPLGDAAAAVLKSIGITKERMKQATGKECGCQARQNAMNSLGASVSSSVASAANAVLNAVAPHPVTPDEVAAVANAMAKNPQTNSGLLSPPTAAS